MSLVELAESFGTPDCQVANPVCDRCQGTGRFKKFGKCFRCDGTGALVAPAVKQEAYEQAHFADIEVIRTGAAHNAFCADLIRKLGEYGSLSPRQLEAGVNAARRVQADRQASNSRHVGTIGARIDLTLTLVRRIYLENDGRFFNAPDRYIFICNDADGNRVLYFGAALCGAFDTDNRARVRATVKEHGERDGIAQTIIQRPKAL